MINNTKLKIFITVGAILLLIVKVVYPKLLIDNTILILIIVGILPWLSGIFKSIELPSGYKIELQDFKDAAEKIINKDDENNENSKQFELNSNFIKPSFLSIIEKDANLAIIGLRLEIDKKLKTLGLLYEIDDVKSTSILINKLKEKGVFSENTTKGLLDIVTLGNKAAHGIEVNNEALDWIFKNGREILHNLDLLASKNITPNTDEKIDFANTILSFEGDKVIDMSISILNLAIQTGHIMIKNVDTLKLRTTNILTKLGALIIVDEFSNGKWLKHKITPLGNALFSFLLNKYK